MADDTTLTLKQVTEEYGYSLSTLRAEAARGRLTLYRIGKRLYTTPADIKEMVRQCRVEQRGQGFTLIRGGSNGSSETDRASSALAAARETVEGLKRHSLNTSATSTNRSRRAHQ